MQANRAEAIYQRLDEEPGVHQVQAGRAPSLSSRHRAAGGNQFVLTVNGKLRLLRILPNESAAATGTTLLRLRFLSTR